MQVRSSSALTTARQAFGPDSSIRLVHATFVAAAGLRQLHDWRHLQSVLSLGKAD